MIARGLGRCRRQVGYQVGIFDPLCNVGAKLFYMGGLIDFLEQAAVLLVARLGPGVVHMGNRDFS